jgi:hypothetical protein
MVRTVVFHVAPAGGGPPVKAPLVPPRFCWAWIGIAMNAKEAIIRTTAIVVTFAMFLGKCIFPFSLKVYRETWKKLRKN